MRRLPLFVVLLVLLATSGYLGWREWTSAHLRRAEAALVAHDDPAAQAHLVRYLAHRPDDARGRLLAARAARRLKQYDAATDHLRACRQNDGDADAIDVEYALAAVQRGDEPPSEGLRERSRRGDETGLAALEVVIQADIDAYRLYAALDGLTAYLAARPGDLAALLSRGFVWERLLTYSDAVEDYRRAVAAHPDSEAARLKLGEALLVAGTPAEALVQFEWLADRTPGAAPARFGLARCRRRLGQTDAARELLDGLLAQYPDRGEVLWERGQLDLDLGRPEAAEAWLRQAVRAAPFDRRVAYAFARCLRQLGRDEATAADARAAELEADLRAMETARTRVLTRPADPAGWYDGGVLFLRNGERAEGVRWLRRALALDPTHEPARRALAGGGQS